MKNKLIIIVSLLGWCSFDYAQKVFTYGDFETLCVEGSCKELCITESKDADLKNSIVYDVNDVEEVGLGTIAKSILVKTKRRTRVTIHIPQKQTINKIITMKEGTIYIEKGSGNITAKIKRGSLCLSPDQWGTTDVTLNAGNVLLNNLTPTSNVLIDLYAKKSELMHNNIGLGYAVLAKSQAWLFWWAQGTMNLGDDNAPKKTIKVWAKDGDINLNSLR